MPDKNRSRRVKTSLYFHIYWLLLLSLPCRGADVKCSTDPSMSLTPNTLDGSGRLLRLDSSVDMKLGDLGGTGMAYSVNV